MKLMFIRAAIPLVLGAWLITAPLSRAQRGIDDAAIANETQTSDWLAYGRTHNERRFSPLEAVNTANVQNLKVAWHLDLPGDSGIVSTPLVVKGVMYFSGSLNKIRAVDAITGRLLWEYDPEVGKATQGRKVTGWAHSRGVSFYNNKLYLATRDGRLIALAATTGKPVWSVQTFDKASPLYITGAPKAFKGKVIIGSGGTEHGPTRGYVTAYDAETGQQAWRFYIVPGNPADGFENDAMAMAAKTWTGEWWKHGGGGNAWHGITYDAELDQLYIGTGNGSPWNQKIRSPQGGDNLFLCSIVALNPDTGKYLWHYQTTPGESWDYNSNMDSVLADLTIGGKPVKALLHAPKNGFFYVIDRKNGKLLSADPFVETSWASHIDMKTGRPVEIPGARYENGPATITPSPWGAHTWHAMSYNPKTGLVYLPALHLGMVYSDAGFDLKTWHSVDFVGGTGVDIVGVSMPKEYPASLMAWDPVARKIAWAVPQSTFWNAGTLTTAGNLVFQGKSDGILSAYDATTGKELWSADLGLGISAPPITYSLNGRQYISILVGFGGGFAGFGGEGAAALGWMYGVQTRRLISFALDGKGSLPPQPAKAFAAPIIDKKFKPDEALAAKGAPLFVHCSGCHGLGAIAGGMAPDLRASAIALDRAAFAVLVRNGERVSKGMPAFPQLGDEDLGAIQHFIRAAAEASAVKPAAATQ
jgi:quinohemoprotein ethanol dehydrogenase